MASEYENQGLGSLIINFIKSYMIKDNKTGCRFLTVDAYAKATDFYKKNDFEYITSLDVLDTTRLMYFDLKNIIKWNYCLPFRIEFTDLLLRGGKLRIGVGI